MRAIKFRVLIAVKRSTWRIVAWLLRHISEALRKDYSAYQTRAWNDGMTARDFDGWLSVRIFGDDGGYRYESFRQENDRLRTEVAALNRSVNALKEVRQKDHIWIGMGKMAVRRFWWLQPIQVPAPNTPGDAPYECVMCGENYSVGHRSHCKIPELLQELAQENARKDR